MGSLMTTDQQPINNDRVDHLSPPPECPVSHQNKSPPAECPMSHQTNQTYMNSKLYNVYGVEIDRRNYMPVNPNQKSRSNQRLPLSTERQFSSIPRGGSRGNWLFPSQQMFFNSLKRKGKGDDVDERDMAAVLACHNNMNNRTWKDVLEWEEWLHNALQAEPGREPRLLRLMAKPDDLSPMARIKTWFGYPHPFDRHDWIIDRGGIEVRYVIDFYENDKIGHIPIVRPAIDSLTALLDRIRMPFVRRFMQPKSVQLMKPTKRSQQYDPPQASTDEKETEIVSEEIESRSTMLQRIQQKCRPQYQRLSQAGEDAEIRSMAEVKLNYCIASIVCPKKVIEFDTAMSSNDDGTDAKATYDSMMRCISTFEQA